MAEQLHRALHGVRAQCRELYELIDEEEAARKRRWEEEKENLSMQLQSLTASYDILKANRKKVKAECQAMLAKAAALTQETKRLAAKEVQQEPNADVVDLQTKLIDLNNRVLDIDMGMKTVNEELATCKPDERDINTTRLVVMQDTRRLLQQEIDALRATIFRIESEHRAAAVKKSAEETGFVALAQLEEQIARTTARMDRVKQLLHFPECKGYRFSTGNNGVYMAAKDLFLSEVSGRFELHCEAVPRAGVPGGKVARLSMALGGASWASDAPRSRPNHKHTGSTSGGGAQAPGGRLARTASASSVAPQAPATANIPAGTPLMAQAPSPLAVASTPLIPSASVASMNTRDDDDDVASLQFQPSASLQPQQPGSPARALDAPGAAGSTGSASSSLAGSPTKTGALAAGPAASAGTISAGGFPLAQSLTPLPAAAPAAATTPLPRPASTAGSSPAATPRAAAAAAAYGEDQLLGTRSSQPKAKGEVVASFLSGLSKKKEKLKGMMNGKSEGGVSGGQLGGQVRQLAERMEERMDRVKDKVKGGLQEGYTESKGKLSKLAKAIANKAPLMKRRGEGGSGGGAPPLTPIASMSYGVAGAAGQGGRDESRAFQDGAPDISDASHHYQEGADEPSELLAEQTSSLSLPSLDEALLMDGYFNNPAAAAAAVSAAGSSVGGAPAGGSSSGGAPAPASTAAAPLQHQQSSSSIGTVLQQQQSLGTISSDGGVYGIGGAKLGSDGAAAGAAAADSVAFEEFEQQPSRKGVYVQLLGEGVQIIGEKGTKVPDMSMRELMLELEVALTAMLEFNPLEGRWHVPSERVEFNILQLDHKLRGNSIPLPRTALKALLNMFLPSAMTKLMLSALPVELGQYVVESGEAMHIAGEVKLMGQALSTFVADLTPLSKVPDAAKRAKWQQQQSAASRARGMLVLSELQTQALSELFSGRSCLLPESGSIASTSTGPRTLSICELCKLYIQFKKSELWRPLCGLWNKALQLAFEHYGVPPEGRFTFNAFMEGPVARLVRKPVHTTFVMDRLKVAVDVDAALHTVRNLFERLAREFHKRAQSGDEGAGVPTEPLEAQLEALDEWHAGLAAALRTFKARFRSASCSFMTSADRDVFQFGLENVTYDGPLRLRLPLDVVLDPDHSFVWDIKLPDREAAKTSLTGMLQEVILSLSGQVASGSETGGDSEARASTSAAPPAAGDAGPASTNAATSALLARWKARAGDAAAALLAEAGASGLGQGGAPGDSLSAPVLEDPVVGRVTARKLALCLKLDEERLAELLASSGGQAGPQLLGQLMGCFGDLFAASLDVGWRPDPEADAANEGALRPACLLTVANNEVTRVNASLESLMFQSGVSPQLAVRMLNAVVKGIMLRFYARGSYHVRFWEKLFSHLHEYLSKDALNAMMCLSARAELVKPQQPQQGQQGQGSEAPGHNSGPAPPQPSSAANGTLRVAIMGDAGGAHIAPIYAVNEVNLLTLMDSMKLLTESG